MIFQSLTQEYFSMQHLIIPKNIQCFRFWNIFYFHLHCSNTSGPRCCKRLYGRMCALPRNMMTKKSVLTKTGSLRGCIMSILIDLKPTMLHLSGRGKWLNSTQTFFSRLRNSTDSIFHSPLGI